MNTQEEKKSHKKKISLTAEEFIPKRFGLNYNPPMIILEFMLRSRGKLYLKKMKLYKLRATTSREVALKYIKMRYPDFFISNQIADKQLLSLIDKLKENLLKDANMKKQKPVEMKDKENNHKNTVAQKQLNPDVKKNNFFGDSTQAGPQIVKGQPDPQVKSNPQARSSTLRKSSSSGSSNDERRERAVIDNDFDDFDEIEDIEEETDEK